LQINLMTSYKEDYLIELNPMHVGGDGVIQRETKVNAAVWLSYWPERHYNSIFLHTGQRLPRSDESRVAFVPSGLYSLHFL
jgi:hypothetical protein